MRVDVTFGRRIRRSVCFVWCSVLLFLAACASSTPQPAVTSTPQPLVGVTITTAPAAAPTHTAVPSPTVPAPTASPQPSQTPIASALPAATATLKATATVAPSATGPAPIPTTAPPTARPTAAADYTPQQVSVWNTALAGTDNMQGTCGNPVNPVYGLVQITPQGNTLVWKNQEPGPYTLSRLRANMWQYSGPTSIGDGTVTMVVQFTSATTLQLTRTFVSNAEPNCTHVHHYTGDFQWNR